jgi:hypothetical protein
MSRLLGVSLFAAVLLAAVGLAPRAQAQPQYVPLNLAPPYSAAPVSAVPPPPPLPMAWPNPCVFPPIPWSVPGGRAMMPPAPPMMPTPPGVPVPTFTPVVYPYGYPPASTAPVLPNPVAEEPAPTLDFLTNMRPSTQRTLTQCLLFGIHPLLSLLPTEWLFDDEDDDVPPPLSEAVPVMVYPAPPAPPVAENHGHVIIGVGLNADMGLTGTFEFAQYGAFACGGSVAKGQAQNCWFRIEAPRPSEPQRLGVDFNAPPGCIVMAQPCVPPVPQQMIGFAAPPPPPMPAPPMPAPTACVAAPVPAPAGLTCPYLTHPQADRFVPAIVEGELGGDVLANLEKLEKAEKLVKEAEKLVKQGHSIEAVDRLGQACKLCPGSRLAEEANAVIGALHSGLYDNKPHWAEGAAEEQEPRAEKIEAPKKTAARSSNEKEAEIIKALEKKQVSFNFEGTPLKQVVEDLRNLTGLNIYVDMPALDEEGISMDTPITIKFEQISLKAGLKMLLHNAKLTYVVQDEVLKITTLESQKGTPYSATYPIGDILDQDFACFLGACKSRAEKANTIVTVIRKIVSSRSWIDAGGPGTIEYFPMSQYLVVNQTADVHEVIAEVLQTLRRQLWLKDDGDASEHAEKLMDACHREMGLGHPVKAAHLARQAFVLDPGKVVSDPLVYKLHLLQTWRKKAKVEIELAGSTGVCCPPPGCPGVKLEVCPPAVAPETVKALDVLIQSDAIGGEECCDEPKPKCECKSGKDCCCPKGECKCGKDGKTCPKDEPKCECKKGKDCCCEKGACKCLATTDSDLWQDLCAKLTGQVCHEAVVSSDGLRLILDFEVGGTKYRLKYGMGCCDLSVVPMIEDYDD